MYFAEENTLEIDACQSALITHFLRFDIGSVASFLLAWAGTALPSPRYDDVANLRHVEECQAEHQTHRAAELGGHPKKGNRRS